MTQFGWLVRRIERSLRSLRPVDERLGLGRVDHADRARAVDVVDALAAGRDVDAREPGRFVQLGEADRVGDVVEDVLAR